MSARLAALMSAAGFTYGAGIDLEDAISYALQELGYNVADVTVPTNAELTAVTNNNHYLDLVELRSLETAYNYLLLKVDLTISGESHQYGQIAQALEKAIERKRKWISARYGLPASGGMGSTAVERYVEDTVSEYT